VLWGRGPPRSPAPHPDQVGNRMELTKNDGGNDTVYGYTYNGLGQLATEYWPYASPTNENVYSYDANGNLVQKLEQYGSPGNWGTEYTWTYYWDTQDRLIKVEKYDEAAEEYDVCVEYKYCPSCGGALSERIEYESDRSHVKSWLRYQYHGLNLLRIDEKYDTDGTAGIQSTDLWRVMNWYVHGPGSIGQTVRATAYSYNHNKTNSPCETNEYYYCYDALGNVNGVLQDGTYYRWETDAFGNDLPEGNDFLPMTSEGPKEHQTGKLCDNATGWYYFHARWLDPMVGLFVSADPAVGVAVTCTGTYVGGGEGEHRYIFTMQSPPNFMDPTGRASIGSSCDGCKRNVDVEREVRHRLREPDCKKYFKDNFFVDPSAMWRGLTPELNCSTELLSTGWYDHATPGESYKIYMQMELCDCTRTSEIQFRAAIYMHEFAHFVDYLDGTPSTTDPGYGAVVACFPDFDLKWILEKGELYQVPDYRDQMRSRMPCIICAMDRLLNAAGKEPK
jgi:RHS repeat-associated protein